MWAGWSWRYRRLRLRQLGRLLDNDRCMRFGFCRMSWGGYMHGRRALAL